MFLFFQAKKRTLNFFYDAILEPGQFKKKQFVVFVCYIFALQVFSKNTSILQIEFIFSAVLFVLYELLLTGKRRTRCKAKEDG